MNPWKIALSLVCMLSLGLSAQDTEKKAGQPAGASAKEGLPCDAATVEDAPWCPKCKKTREAAQLEGEKCKDCQTATEKIKVCVKKWIPRCGMHNQGPHLENCCKSKFCCKLETIKSPLAFKCEGCGKSAREEARIEHDAKAHEKKVLKTCEASGTQPHGGEPIK